MKKYTLVHSDCLVALREMPDNSVDSIVTDPPYGLSFMGKKWDYDVPSEDIWRECLRVLKPGGYLLAFAGTRTQHRMAVRIEDAGFEIRDMIAWVYGTGFPKSLDVSKAIGKAAGAEREILGIDESKIRHNSEANHKNGQVASIGLKAEGSGVITKPATEDAKQWEGWGTALKPALEPITVARKPLAENTVAANVLKHGVGGINIDGCRIETVENLNGGRYSDNKIGNDGNSYGKGINNRSKEDYSQPLGRFPANLIHDGSEEVLAEFPDSKGQQGDLKGHSKDRKSKGIFGDVVAERNAIARNDIGSAARFFYTAKASKRDRNDGLSDGGQSTHPTVKPTTLMQYLCRLVTPPNGTVLDPFMGSGSTGKAAMYEGFDFIGIEREQEYVDLSRARIEFAVSDNETNEVVDNQLSLFP